MRPATTAPSTATFSDLPVEPALSEAAAEAWIPRTFFKNGPPHRLGVELEFLVAGIGDDALVRQYPRDRYPHLIDTVIGTAPDDPDGGLDGRVTVEPGGQVELSSRPADTLAAAVDTVHHDLSRLRRRARTGGARLIGLGVDPVRAPRRIIQESRYRAMEGYFRPWGQTGPAMMCSTASVQINVEAATPTVDVLSRWELLHAIGPTLVAAFANSPRRLGRPTGFKSTRQAIWQELDPARTGAPPRAPGTDPAAAWARWALDAPLMLIRRAHSDWSAPPGLSMRSWIRHGRAAVADRPAPTIEDLTYHLSTLFPPVRPRGHLEIRYLDALPGCWWIVPAAVVSALLDDPVAADRARAACEPVQDRWRSAARSGVQDPALGRAAIQVLTTAAEALRGDPAGARLADPIEQYLQRWTLRGRSPADDPPVAAGREPACDESEDYREGTA